MIKHANAYLEVRGSSRLNILHFLFYGSEQKETFLEFLVYIYFFFNVTSVLGKDSVHIAYTFVGEFGSIM